MELWRFRGSPHYLAAQAKRLGLPQVLADRARHNAEIFRVQVLVSQLCERYHRAPKDNGVPRFGGPELGQIRGTIEQAELECKKLHMLAATSAAILDEACAAFAIERARRPYEILCEYDPVITTLRDAAPGTSVIAAGANGAVLELEHAKAN